VSFIFEVGVAGVYFLSLTLALVLAKLAVAALQTRRLGFSNHVVGFRSEESNHGKSFSHSDNGAIQSTATAPRFRKSGQAVFVAVRVKVKQRDLPKLRVDAPRLGEFVKLATRLTPARPEV
jgi:hypothetical protein